MASSQSPHRPVWGILGVLTVWVAFKGLLLQLWTSRKDFREYCENEQQLNRTLSSLCIDSLKISLGPPPGPIFKRVFLERHTQSSTHVIVISPQEFKLLLVVIVIGMTRDDIDPHHHICPSVKRL